MTNLANERRGGVRRVHAEEHGILAARIRPGYAAAVINISAAGALVETDHRLLPDAPVELHLTMHDRHVAVRARVLRCTVVGLRPSSVCYRAAVRFDRDLPWFVEERASGYQVPSSETRPALPPRADSTPQLA